MKSVLHSLLLANGFENTFTSGDCYEYRHPALPGLRTYLAEKPDSTYGGQKAVAYALNKLREAQESKKRPKSKPARFDERAHYRSE